MKLAITVALSILGSAAWPQAAKAMTDDDFASQLHLIQNAIDNRKINGRILPVTQEYGPNDPKYKMQAPFIKMIQKVLPSVVLLIITEKDGKEEALCAGFFIETKGYSAPTPGQLIVTNAHCVEEVAVGDIIQVGLYDGDKDPKMTPGKVLAFGNSKAAKDVAFVKLMDHRLNRPGLPLWEKLKVGEQVAAIGHPLGLIFSVTKGIISALRDQGTGQFVLGFDQTDAPINQGNSGGPLFNMWGSVVGINSMIVEHSDGLAFVLPAAYIKKALQQYCRTGNLKIGVLQAVFDSDTDTKKLIVQKVDPAGPLDRAQIKEKDVVIAIDGLNLEAMTPSQEAGRALDAHIRYMSPGETVTMVVRRGERNLTVQVTLGEPPKPVKKKWWFFPR